MKTAFVLPGSILIGLLLIRSVLGAWPTLRIACGAVVILSAVIAATFLWLWRRNATPLAIGMVMSWSGSALALSWWLAASWWWWIEAAERLARDPAGSAVLLGFVALHLSGAVVHFCVIAESLRLPPVAALAMPALAFAASGGIHALL